MLSLLVTEVTLLQTVLCTTVVVYCKLYYHIALIFRGSKFSQIAAFDNFIEKISRICCRSRRWYGVSKFSLKYFCKCRENRENLDPQNISAIW